MSYTAILLKIKAIGRPITMGLSEPQELKNGLKAAAMKNIPNIPTSRT